MRCVRLVCRLVWLAANMRRPLIGLLHVQAIPIEPPARTKLRKHGLVGALPLLRRPDPIVQRANGLLKTFGLQMCQSVSGRTLSLLSESILICRMRIFDCKVLRLPSQAITHMLAIGQASEHPAIGKGVQKVWNTVISLKLEGVESNFYADSMAIVRKVDCTLKACGIRSCGTQRVVPVLHTGLISCSTGTSIPPKVENPGSTSVDGSRD
jgi:hypothetical protein